MFKYKNAMISMAVVAMLAACGGGGGGDGDRTGNRGGNGGTTQPDQSGAIAPTADQKLAAGVFTLSGGGVAMGGSGDTISQLPYDEFVRGPDNPRTGEPPVAGYGLYAQALGTNAPLESFGFTTTFGSTSEGATGTSVGRVAFELQDQTTGTEDPARALRIMVDQVTYTVNAMGDVSVSLGQDSKAYVYAKNGANSATVTTTAASNLVRIVEGIESADPARFALMLDVDQAVTDALAAATTAGQSEVLDSVKTFSATAESPFKVSISFSNLDIERAGTDLAAPTISVNGSGVAGVRDGSGATGYLQVGTR